MVRPLRVATLNLWNRGGPWEERLAAIRAHLARERPDVIGLQEALRFPGFDQAALVAEGLGYEVAWGEASPNHGFPMGNAVLSRLPIRETRHVLLPNGGTDEQRALVSCRLEGALAPDGAPNDAPDDGSNDARRFALWFHVTHLNWRLDEPHVRALQVRAVADEVLAREAEAAGAFASRGATDLPAVLVGDFNAEPDADEMRFLRGLTALGGVGVRFTDAFAYAGDGSPGVTFSRENPFAAPLREPDRRIDYVYVRGPDDAGRGQPLACRVAFREPVAGVHASDHFGVVAELAVG